MWLFWLFVAVPIIEIALFIQVGGLIGLWPTLGIVVLTAVIGTSLMRSQGAHAWNEIQRSFNELRDPSRPLAHGVMILIAGMLLLTPGFFTDTIGLLLLIPAVRDRVMAYVGRHIRVTRVSMASYHREAYRGPGDDGIIDAEFVVEDEPSAPRPPNPDLPPADRGDSGWTRH